MKKYEVQPGNEIRGFMIRLYPSKEEIACFEQLETCSRTLWNWLVKQTEDVLQARQAHAVKYGLVPAKPQRPVYDGMEPKDAKEAAATYRKSVGDWHQLVNKATNKLAGCEFRKLKDWQAHFGYKQDYQMLGRVLGFYHPGVLSKTESFRPKSHVLQALTKNYFQKSDRRKKRRKKSDPMPIQTRSGDCFESGDFGNRGGNKFYNCQIKINGLKIRGRLPGITPTGRVLEGVSVTRKADGWWASIKQEVAIRVPPPAIPGSVIGLDVGLDIAVAMSDGTKVSNPRNKEFAERVANRQSIATSMPEGEERKSYENTTHRLQLKAQRRMLYILYSEVVKPLARVETIKIEKLTSKIGQMAGSSKISVMRKVRELLVGRYGERVREVECAYTSQDCSQCGERSKDTWSYEHGRYGECPCCGYREDRDVNAARNIAAKPMILLAA